MSPRQDNDLIDLVRNQNTSRSTLLEILNKLDSGQHLEELTKNPALALILIYRIYDLYYSPDAMAPGIDTRYENYREVSSERELPNFFIQYGSHHPHEEIRAFIARNEHTPLSYLEKLPTDEEYEVIKEVAYNQNTPASILERLANDDEYCPPDLEIANNQNTPPSILAKLAEEENYEVRAGVASNRNTAPSILERLAAAPEVLVRRKVAYNENTPVSILEKLASAEEREYYILIGVLENPNTPQAIKDRIRDEVYSLEPPYDY